MLPTEYVGVGRYSYNPATGKLFYAMLKNFIRVNTANDAGGD